MFGIESVKWVKVLMEEDRGAGVISLAFTVTVNVRMVSITLSVE